MDIYTKLDKVQDEQDGLSITEFVEGVEQIVDLVSEPPPLESYLSPWRVSVRRLWLGPYDKESLKQVDGRRVRSPRVNRISSVSLLIVLLNTACVCLYGSLEDTVEFRRVSQAAVILSVLSVLDVCMWVLVYGFDEYYYYVKYHRHEKQASAQTFANRFDLMICGLSLVGYVLFFFMVPEDNLYKIITALPVLRLVTLVTRCRMTFHSLLLVIPTFVALFKLLFVFNYFFSVYGHLLFRDADQFLFDMRIESTWDTLSESMMSVCQLLLGEGWHDIMNAAILVSHLSLSVCVCVCVCHLSLWL